VSHQLQIGANMSSLARRDARLGIKPAIDSGIWAALRPLHVLMTAPSVLFLAALTVMLFRPPDLQFHSLDRIALLALIFVVLLRRLALQQSPWIVGPVTLPLLGLLLLALSSVLMEPYEAQNWSLFAAKWLVPFVLYHVAGFVFQDAKSLLRFETFAIVILAYLSLTAIFFLIDARSLIFPRYILDESIGIHTDRARGPFLQAVANGVTLNLLGLIAMDSFRRGKLRGLLALLFMIALPLAILATRTRAVWASFAGSLLILPFVYPFPKVRRACLCLLMTGGIGIASFALFGDANTSLNDRLRERGPVEFRMGMYAAGWEMFLDKPILGWSANRIQPELARRISDFHPPYFLFHNTYLEIAVKHGLLGLCMYLWVIVDLFRLGSRRRNFKPFANGHFLDPEFRRLWPVLLVVYLVNASFVVMSYQFVNGLLFTIAGMLASQNRRAESNQTCLT
jgi:putative inorganic carbon (HCO3(-)) transporter